MPAKKEMPQEAKEQVSKLHIVDSDEESSQPKWFKQLKTNVEGYVTTRSILNVKTIILNDSNLKGHIFFDEFAEMIIKKGSIPVLKSEKGFWNDSDGTMLRAYLESEYNLLFSDKNILDGVVVAARANSINPIKQRIEAVKWDGKPRAERYFIDYLGAEDSHYTKAITKIWLAGIIARTYRPGTKFEIVPILEGKQGIGKSTVASNLFPNAFSDSLKDMGISKDSYQQLQGNVILELAELSAMKRTDIENMKNFVSSLNDKYRASYGTTSIPHPRKCVFIGTTNQTDYLKDATGERRFYPIKCDSAKRTKNPWQVDQNDILQILAEAKHWFDVGTKLYPDTETAKEAEKYQKGAKMEDPMKDAVNDYLNMEVPTNWTALSRENKQTYYRHYIDNEPLGEWLINQINSDRELLQQTTTKEILSVVFGKTVDKYLTGSINIEAKKISLIINNNDEWHSVKLSKNAVTKKRAVGFKRINSN